MAKEAKNSAEGPRTARDVFRALKVGQSAVIQCRTPYEAASKKTAAYQVGGLDNRRFSCRISGGTVLTVTRTA